MILVLVLSLIQVVVSSGVGTIDQCALRCKDNHMSQGMDNEWSSDFTLPVMNLLRKTGNETAAYNKVLTICAANQEFDMCLSQCNTTVESSIIRTGLVDWQVACENLNMMRSQFPCWKQHGERMSMECREYTVRLRQGLEMLSTNQSLEMVANICGEFLRFSGCFTSQYGTHCGYRSEYIVSKLFDANKESIFQMLKLRFKTNLPPACSPSAAYRRDVNNDYLGRAAWLSGESSTALIPSFIILVALIVIQR